MVHSVFRYINLRHNIPVCEQAQITYYLLLIFIFALPLVSTTNKFSEVLNNNNVLQNIIR
jgi:hypothetical protein